MHVLHALNKGYTIIDRHCCDNDWALLTNSYLRPIHSLSSTSLCICLDKFGYGKALPAVNPICASLGPDTSREMPLFHSFTGCFLQGKGKEIHLGSLEVVS